MKEFDKKSSPGREGFSKFLPASMSDSSTRRRLTEYEIQVQDLQAYVRSLEAETVHLRKRLEDTPKDFMVLENKLREANRQLVQAFNQNEKLVNALYEAREQITALKEEVDKLCAPPSTYGVYLSLNEDGTVNILAQGRKVKVNLHPSIKAEEIKPGQELVLNEGLNVVELAGYEIQGEVVILKEVLDAGPGRSLGDDARFKGFLGRVGADNLGVAFVDVAAIRALIEPLAQGEAPAEAWSYYTKEIQPYLAPLDAVISGIRKDNSLDRGTGAFTVH